MIELQPLVNSLERELLGMNKSAAKKIISEAASKIPPIQAASEIVTMALDHIGLGWEEGKYSLSQVYISGLICEEAVDEVLPPKAPERKDLPKMAIGVFEDFHVLGKRIIYSSVRAGGYEITDLGNGLSKSQVVSMVKEQNIAILLLSTLMLPSALKLKELTDELREFPVKIIVGGAPFRFDENLWREVGAFATGRNPMEALQLITELTGGKA